MGPEPQADRIQRANEIFATAIGLPPDQRRRVVQDRCSGDPALEQSVLRLLGKFDSIGDFLETPPYPAAIGPEPGDVLAGRFQILGKLGAGGMGEVYQAHDSVLHDTVALKLIHPAHREDEELAARFCDEIRLARKVAHPNVCRTFDAFSASWNGEPLLFFTMAFLEGETLAARIRAAGRLGPAETLEIAAQIADGLDAAHREGIVHRDLKPSNIMLVPRREGGPPQAVITDFGLAKPFDRSASGHTQAGQLLGSPQYMAPEQFWASEVTAAADIYALGVIVYEMVSGRRPFPDDTLVRMAIRRMTEDAPALETAAPGVPVAWTAPLSRALSRDPSARMRSAGELIRQLERPRRGLPRPSRRVLIYSAAGAVGVSAFAAASRFSLWKPAKFQGAPAIMFANASETGTEHQAAAAFTTLLERQLDVPRVGVLARERIAAAWRRMRPDGAPIPVRLQVKEAREVALRGGANLVAFVGATRKLDDWSFWVRLESLGSSPAAAMAYWEREFRSSLAGDRFAASVAAARWLRETVGVTLSANRRERTPQELTTTHWEALEEFTQADVDWAAGNRDSAMRHLKTALDLDPEFPLAAARLADNLTASGRVDEGLDYYSRAADLVRKRNLTDRESLRIRTLFAFDTGQNAAAEEAASRWATEYPEDAVALIHQATTIEGMGQPEAALRLLDLAVERLPNTRPPLMRRAMVLLRAGRLDDAARDADRLAKIPPVDSTWQLRSALAVGRLDLPAAWSALEEMRKAAGAPSQSASFNLQACFRAEQGRYGEAARLLDEGISFDRARSSLTAGLKKRRLLAQLFVSQGRTDAALEQCRLVAAAAPGHALILEIGCVMAQAGDLAGARACLRPNLPDWPIYTHWRNRLEGWIALASGKADLALEKMSVPADPARQLAEWPMHLARAAALANRPDTVKHTLSLLLDNPARYWFNADVTGPGYLAWAVRSLDRWMDPAMRTRAASLHRAFTAA